MHHDVFSDVLFELREIRDQLRIEVAADELSTWTRCLGEALMTAHDAVVHARDACSAVDHRATMVAVERLLGKIEAEIQRLSRATLEDSRHAETQIQLGRTQQVGLTSISECLQLVEQSHLGRSK